MSIEELNKVFDWLEKEMNKQKLFDFKYNSSQITVYFKDTNKIFAQVYPNKVLEIIKKWEEIE